MTLQMLLWALVGGVVQGVTEFLPVSSSAHLEVVPWLLGLDGAISADVEHAFDVAVHVGTLSGAVVFLRADIARCATAAWRVSISRNDGPCSAETRRDARAGLLIAASALPAAAVGFFGQGWLLARAEQPLLIAALLIVFGWLLWAAALAQRRSAQHRPASLHSRAAARSTDRTQEAFGWADAAVMGTMQAVALLPGVSRSGIAITAGLLRGFSLDAAARLAFLMSLPVIAGVGLYRFAGLSGTYLSSDDWAVLGVGMSAAAVVSWAALWGVLRLIRRNGTAVLLTCAWYRTALGVLIAAVALSGVR